MTSDLRLAWRQLTKSPGFAAVAILTLALGIGISTAMFSLVDAVLLRPLPFRDPSRLVWIENTVGSGLSGRTSRADVFNGWREQSQTLESLAAYFAFSDYLTYTLSGGDRPERIRSVGVSDNFLPTLGVTPMLGRNFTAAECAFNAPSTMILSYGFWRRRYAGDPNIIGRKVTLNDKPSVIIGVLPRSFAFDSIFTPGSGVDFLAPFPLTVETARWGNTVFGIGRMKPTATPAQVQAELHVISERLRTHIRGGNFDASIQSLDDALRGRFRRGFVMLTGAVVCVLAIACVNLSNLLLSRINVRRHEFAIRIAVGARRRHLIRQTLTESLLLALAGAALGTPAAILATRVVAQLQAFGVPLLRDSVVDGPALAVTVGITGLVGIMCGILPALHLSRRQSGLSLQGGNRLRGAGAGSSLVRSSLVVAEVALACMLLVGAGLLYRSFSLLLQVDLGFQPQHAIAWRVDPPAAEAQKRTQYLDELVRRVSALPGVDAVGLSDTLPLGRNRTWYAGALGIQYPPGEAPGADPRLVDDHYLQAMRIPLRAGRYFDARDSDPKARTIIINESLARLLWPDRDPIGQKLAQDGGRTVVGVVENVRYRSLEGGADNEMYIDYRQNGDWWGIEMVVRSALPAESLVRQVRAEMTAYDSSLPNGDYYELEHLVDNAVASRRLITRLLGFFSAVALALAAIGLYGVIAYSVTQRTQEIGIRMAIGAQRHDILAMVLSSGVRLVALGIVLGIGGAFALTRGLSALLFGVTAHDPWTFASNAVLLLLVAIAACLIPALRATRVDPMAALRTE